MRDGFGARSGRPVLGFWGSPWRWRQASPGTDATGDALGEAINRVGRGGASSSLPDTGPGTHRGAGSAGIIPTNGRPPRRRVSPQPISA